MTEGARRTLRRAARLAAADAAETVEPRHLLWALLLEESRAAELLAAYGISREGLQERLPLHHGPGEPAEPSPPESASPPRDETFQAAVAEARRRAALAGRHAETGTEHLLWALVATGSPVSGLLREFGLDEEGFGEEVGKTSGLSAEPLEAGFTLAPEAPAAADRTDTLRLLDAAANRAREGLRVVEDFVRFRLDDAHLAGLLKECRHRLAEALREIDYTNLLAARETQHDVGTGLSTPAESFRAAPWDVVTSNLKRVQEAVRSLEEFGKVVAPPMAAEIEQLRYRLYTVEKAVASVRVNRSRLEGCHLCLLVTESLCHHGSGPAVRESVAAGVGMVQVREKSWRDRELLEHARRVRAWTREAGALCIINDRPDLAVLAEADGVHVGQDELTVREARRILGPERIVGVSTHTIEQARQAVLDGADYLGVGPVFPSQTKFFDELAGLEFVRQAATEITLPWFAIGGITAENVDRVLEAGATRIAVSGAICAAEQPGEAARELLDRLQKE